MSTLIPLLYEVVISGGVKVWNITGTINDSAGSGLVGVTVTLTGDASDSTTSAADGTYSFSGLVDGDYTVTPTKAGSTFSPASDAITVSGGAEVAATMAQVWSIAGAVLDADAAAVVGITVTLGGDASDTDTTAGDGSYSFGGLSDGNYTTTPTNSTRRKNDPASNNEAVSGADVTGSDFTEYYFLSRDFNDETIGQAPAADVVAWEDSSGDIGTFLVAAWYDGDADNWNPTGFTKALEIVQGQATAWTGFYIDLGATAGVRPSYATRAMNFELLLTCHAVSGTEPWRGRPYCAISDGTNGPWGDNSIMSRYLSYTEIFDSVEVTAGSRATLAEVTTGIDQLELYHWNKYRVVIQPNGDVVCTMVRAATDVTLATTASTNASTWSTLRGAARYFWSSLYETAPSGQANVWIARSYLADSALGWPSDA